MADNTMRAGSQVPHATRVSSTVLPCPGYVQCPLSLVLQQVVLGKEGRGKSMPGSLPAALLVPCSCYFLHLFIMSLHLPLVEPFKGRVGIVLVGGYLSCLLGFSNTEVAQEYIQMSLE